ncbi:MULTISPECIES: 23S rRNA (adenine(2503)-C(2))-methyltransferase RlmN [unclassified Lentimicrobium]|uniref:23S rRNA (adenine(2503)-C(2))-methyltransferase RlmN n=1 Tax=unclassified Lentimicrobium TaxID=2677434 RepID=UPI001553A510|nr:MULTISPECIES: 23S rRNA (adenine(2503)-C(2))-methyltransferase RlmN [unclassified Lentimicrobium]NPD46028.1 23S rRNA (adenine(2503)-C(2))-methyltransferase RlmN [Lentimicrobium sp. S6]NPD85228.1 23S rRNA (adenine(2503)-C(2))-methyltransferase RlmN [Lentimicrobium sp. L6]
MVKENIFGKTKKELQELVVGLGLAKFIGTQLAEWMYKNNARTFEDMHNISKKAKALLDEKYQLERVEHGTVQKSVDGTKKYLFHVRGSHFIEAAFIPDRDRATLCVSSQVGCKMGCLFCMTGKQGFQANLSTGEILNQIYSLPEFDQLTNVVYMGMGEPFDNLDNVLRSIEILTADYGMAWSPRRITVSTIGIIPAMKTFLEKSEAHLAISLHSPFEEERKKIMPIENVYNLPKLLEVISNFEFGGQRRVSFEYIMFKDFNDGKTQVDQLARILNGIKSRINLIRFHPIPGTPLLGSDDETILKFQADLKKKGIMTTIRASRGQDIFAACGLLSTKELVKRKEEEDF